MIRRTAVVRTRMPGGVGGAAPRGAPLSRLQGFAAQPRSMIGIGGGWTNSHSPRQSVGYQNGLRAGFTRFFTAANT
jgi:hypothetical protein